MELTFRIGAVALLGAAACTLIKRGGGAMTLPLAAAVCCYALWAAVAALRPAKGFLDTASALSGLSQAYFVPVVKCVVIGLLTRVAADLCRDGGQSAIAGTVEYAGAAAALATALPLLQTLLGTLEKLM